MVHFLRREHPGHQLRVVHVVRVLARDLLAPDLQPVLHHLDLVRLRHVDPVSQQPHILAARARGDERHHFHGLRVMADHPLHESDVRLGVADVREIGGGGGRHDAARLARRARLDNRRLRRNIRRAAGRTGKDSDTDCGACRSEQFHGIRLAALI